MNPGSGSRELFTNRNIDDNTGFNFIVNYAKKSWIPDRIPIGKNSEE